MTSSVGRKLSSGDLRCFASVVDPPAGSGTPDGFISFGFSGTAGIRESRLEINNLLSPGQGVERLCESRVAEADRLARRLGCQCSLSRDQMVDALEQIGILAIVATP